MKINILILTAVLSLSPISLLFAQSTAATPGYGVGNGDDAFSLPSGEVQVLDVFESAEAFTPDESDAFRTIIDPQLTKFGLMYPEAEAYLRWVFHTGAFWFLGNFQLKQINMNQNDGPETSLIEKATKKAIAVTKQGFTRIHKPAWDLMGLKEKAFLLMYQVLWTAEIDKVMFQFFATHSPKPLYFFGSDGFTLHSDPAKIQALTSVMLSPNMDNCDPQILGDLIRKFSATVEAGTRWERSGKAFKNSILAALVTN